MKKQEQVEFLPQNMFPYLEEYKLRFAVTDKTVFAWDDKIYANYELPKHLLIHEKVHHKQQKNWGLENWRKLYLDDKVFRAMQEMEAYIVEIESIKDRNQRHKHKIHCAKTISSDLYGNMITYEEAMRIL